MPDLHGIGGFGIEGPMATPTTELPPDERAFADGTALCLSGGGYRAMLFHVGALRRLNDSGRLRSLTRVSSVSGGSITAAVLGMAWSTLDWDTEDRATNLVELVESPLRQLATHDLDARSVFKGLLIPGRTVSETLTRSYDRHLFSGATLQDLPADDEGPRFVLNATSLKTGKLFRFSRPYEGDYTVGLRTNPTTSLADAVAASSAFPPVLSPHRLTWTPNAEANESRRHERHDDLADGGVYDNLGLETAWKACRELFVSDAGGVLHPEAKPRHNWLSQTVRVLHVIDGQVRALRKRQLIDGFRRGLRTGAYWGIASDPRSYGVEPTTMPTPDAIRIAQTVPTRLSPLNESTQSDLIEWGAAISDVALRRWVEPGPAVTPHRSAHQSA